MIPFNRWFLLFNGIEFHSIRIFIDSIQSMPRLISSSQQFRLIGDSMQSILPNHNTVDFIQSKLAPHLLLLKMRPNQFHLIRSIQSDPCHESILSNWSIVGRIRSILSIDPSNWCYHRWLKWALPVFSLNFNELIFPIDLVQEDTSESIASDRFHSTILPKFHRWFI